MAEAKSQQVGGQNGGSGASSGSDTVQQIKDRLSIVEVITPYVKLTRAGKGYKGLTPFGKEKTPSFYVSPDRGSYYCFSTSQGGDHFTFIEKMEGVDFKGALKILAEKAGVEIQQLRPEARAANDRRDRLREAIGEAERFFAASLTENSPALVYAKARGLTDETIRSWNLGFSPDGWRGLLEHLGAAASGTTAFTVKELAAAGLVKEADEKPGTWYDRFRNRLMFPIRDIAGRTVAFTGRALDPDDQAKYLNSPETDLYKKSEVLFGMDKAKDSIRARGFAILVEGQFDLLLLHQAGFTNTIAISGTALSSIHLGLIKRYADNLMLALDADKAGLSAAMRSAHAALSAGMRVKAVRLPAGKDPADIVSAEGGPAAFAELVKSAPSAIEYFLQTLSAAETDDFKLLRRVEETVLPLVAAVKSPLERSKYIEMVARHLSQSPEAVREALPRSDSGQGREGAVREAERTNAADSRKNAAPPASEAISPLDSRRDFLFAVIKAYPDTGLAERLKIRYCEIINAPEFPLEALADLDERLLFEAEQQYGEAPSDEAGDELLRIFELMYLRDARNHVQTELRKAESVGDSETVNDALARLQGMDSRISALS